MPLSVNAETLILYVVKGLIPNMPRTVMCPYFNITVRLPYGYCKFIFDSTIGPIQCKINIVNKINVYYILLLLYIIYKREQNITSYLY